MATNKISFTCLMFVVVIAYLGLKVVFEFNILDFIYLIFMIGSFIRLIYLRKMRKKYRE